MSTRDISTAPDAGHPLHAGRVSGARIGSSASRDALVPDILFAFDGVSHVPIDVRPRIVAIPIELFADDPTQAQSITITMNASGEAQDSFFGPSDPPSPLLRGPQMLRVLRMEHGSGAPDSLEVDIGTGQAITIPSRYARATILDYSADLVRSIFAPEVGRAVPPVTFSASASTGVRTPSSRRTQIAYVTGDQLARGEPGADAAWTAAALAWAPYLAAAQALVDQLFAP